MTLRALSTVGWAPSLCPGCGAAIAYFRCRCPVVAESAAVDDGLRRQLAVALQVQPGWQERVQVPDDDSIPPFGGAA